MTSFRQRFSRSATDILVLMGLGSLLVLGHHYDWQSPWSSAAVEGHKASPSTVTSRGLLPSASPEPRPVALRLASAEGMAKAQVRTAAVESSSFSDYVNATGSLQYDRTRLAQLAPRVAGVVWEVLVKVGAQVEEGQALALIESAEIGKAKSDFLQAIVQCELKEKLASGARQVESVLPPRRVLELESSLREARLQVLTARQALLNLGLALNPEAYQGLSDENLMEALRTLGLPAEIGPRLTSVPAAANLIALRAPFRATVIASELVKGEAVHPGKPGLTLADTAGMWVVLEVVSEDAGRLRCGQDLVFRPDGMGQTELASKLAWISSEADPKTRRVQARAEVQNPAGHLRANTFGTGKIKVGAEAAGLAVATDALHWDLEQQAHLVFVRRDEQTFEACPVKAGVRHGTRTQVSPVRPGSLCAGEQVAAQGSYILKAELLRQRWTATR